MSTAVNEPKVVARGIVQEIEIDPLNPDIPPPGERWRRAISSSQFKPTSSPEQLDAAIRLLANGREDVLAILSPVTPMVWTRAITEEELQSIREQNS